MVIYSNPCKMRLIVLPHRMNTRLSHGYSMLGVATKERNIPYLDNVCFLGGEVRMGQIWVISSVNGCVPNKLAGYASWVGFSTNFWYQNIVVNTTNILIRNNKKS